MLYIGTCMKNICNIVFGPSKILCMHIQGLHTHTLQHVIKPGMEAGNEPKQNETSLHSVLCNYCCNIQ